MAYNKQTWVDHDEDAVTGEVIVEGTPVDKLHLDHIEDGIAKAHTKADDVMTQFNNLATVATHTKSGTVHTLVLSKAATAGIQMVQFKATADYAEGNTWKVGAVVYTAKLQGEDGVVPDMYFVVGDMVSVLLDPVGKKLGFKSGGNSKPPTAWAFLQVLTSTTVWTPPGDGWYRIYVVGKSGNGGRGISRVQNGGGASGSSGAAGGNSGGVAISELRLKNSHAIQITVTDALTSFGGFASATFGGNGNNGLNQNSAGIPDRYNIQGGAPSDIIGDAYGGNVINSRGLIGGNGGNCNGYYDKVSEGGESKGKNTGGVINKQQGSAGGGGAGNDLPLDGIYKSAANLNGGGTAAGYEYTMPFSAPLPTTPPLVYGSGGGGAGATSMANWKPICDGQVGGMGTPACIIIERGV